MGWGRTPGVVSITLDPPLVTLSEHNHHLAGSILIDSSVRDARGSPTRTTIIKPGAVLALVTATGKYVEADSASADKKTAASVQTKIAISAWNTGPKTFKWSYKGGGTQTVTGGTADTAAQMISDLNADANFSADLIAEAGTVANTVKISARRAGVLEWFEIKDGTVNDQGGTAEDTLDDNTQHAGTSPKVCVIDEMVDLLDPNGDAIDASARGKFSGHFKESNLVNMDAHAKSVLLENGSFFG